VTSPSPTQAHPRPEDAGGTLVEVEHLVKDFGDHRALDDISLTVPRGAIVGLIGPSGCGKTTLVRTMLGLLVPSSGTVRVFGQDPITLSAGDRQRIAYMPQLPVLFPNLSVIGNLRFVASLYAVPMRGRRRRLHEILEFVDLDRHASKRLADCSGGMQRRLTLAATLVHQPELIYLDEPTAGVDPILRDRFWGHFREMRNDGRTIIVPTQYVGEAVSCDHVAIISDGRLISFSTPDDLRRSAFAGVPMRLVLASGWLPQAEMERIESLPFVHSVRRFDDDLMIVVDDPERDREPLAAHLSALGLPPVALEPIEPTFDQIFVELVERDRAASAAASVSDDDLAVSVADDGASR
jgi:ABC-2 type transport system ATP-binding protein